MYNIKTGEDKKILRGASNFGIYKGELYYIDEYMKLYKYDIDTGKSTQVISAYVRFYIPIDGKIVYVYAMDSRLKLDDGENVKVLVEDIIYILDYDEDGIYCITRGGENIRVNP